MKLYGVKKNGVLMRDDEGHPVLTESESQTKTFLDALRAVCKIMGREDKEEYTLATFREDIAPNPYLFTVHCRNGSPKYHKGHRIWAKTKEDILRYVKWINEEDGDWKIAEEEPPTDAFLHMVGYRVRSVTDDKLAMYEAYPAVFRRHSDAQCFINTQNTDKLYIQVDLVSDASIRKEYQ